jgi:hypothetical protein
MALKSITVVSPKRREAPLGRIVFVAILNDLEERTDTEELV